MIPHVTYAHSGVPMATSLPSSADVVVIGGGIMGTSTAWHLAQQKAGRVVLLEKATIAAGASGWTGALLRRHYTNLPEATLAHQSHLVFRNWAEIVGGSCGYEPQGLIVTVDQSPEVAQNVELLSRNVEFQQSLGIETEVVTAEQLKALQRWCFVDDIQTAAYEPISGYADAPLATRSMADAAERAGATILEWVETACIRTDGTRVIGVETNQGTIATNTVVLAAGPWSSKLAATAGVLLPIETIRVQIAIVHRPRELTEPHFVFLDMAAGCFMRPWAPGRSLLGVAGGDQHDAVDPDNFALGNDPAYPDQAKAAAAKRIPAMSRAQYLHGHAGLYDMSPDTHPIIGLAGPEGLIVACGFSGAGFKKGPAVGQCIAELITEGQSNLVDLAPFRIERFDAPGWDRPWSDTEYAFTSDFGHKL
jgi:glycine/D-amino acid oxidase-like deaminating enzyme